MLGELVERAIPLARATVALRTREATAVDVDVDLGDGRWLRGTVPEVYGDRLVRVSYSRLGATHRLQSWLLLLALSAADPDRNWTAHTIGRPTNSRSHDAHATSLLGPIDDYAARDALRALVDLRDRGLAGPLPLPIKASFSYAKLAAHRRHGGRGPAQGRLRLGRRQVPRRVLGRRKRAGLGSAAPLSPAQAPSHFRARRCPASRAVSAPSRCGCGARCSTPSRGAGDGPDPATPPAMETFDLCGPLPTGTTLLEASAGTGKTFTVAAARHPVRRRGARPARRDARHHVRAGRQPGAPGARPRPARRGRACAGRPEAPPRSPTPCSRCCSTRDAEERRRRSRRLREALATFDAATIATTHQFCQLVLRSLGVAGDTDPGVTLVESLDDLVDEVVDDLYLQRFGQLTGRPPFDRDEALDPGLSAAVGDPQARLIEPEAEAESRPAAAGRVRPRRTGSRSSIASAASASSAMTTC